MVESLRIEADFQSGIFRAGGNSVVCGRKCRSGVE